MSLPLQVCQKCKQHIWLYATKCNLCGTDFLSISTHSQETTFANKNNILSAKSNILDKSKYSSKINTEPNIRTASFESNKKTNFINGEKKIKSSLFWSLGISFVLFIITFNIYKPKEQLFRPMPSDPVAVRGYTKSNGEIVSSYHRKLPGQRGLSTPEQEVWFFQMKEDIKVFKSKRNDALIWSSIVSLFCFYVLYNLFSGK